MSVALERGTRYEASSHLIGPQYPCTSSCGSVISWIARWPTWAKRIRGNSCRRAMASSRSAQAFIGCIMLDCPQKSQTSPTSTLENIRRSVSSSLLPLASMSSV